MNKKEFLLESIIKAYIEHLEPIGSSQLKIMCNISYSSATIRGYFKKLGEEGYLKQEHISSGRTPTYEALKEYWNERLSFDFKVINKYILYTLSKQMGISVFIKKDLKSNLEDIINIGSKYILLDFGKFAVNIRYSNHLYRFLSQMIGLKIEHIVDISKQVGAIEIYTAINQYIQNNKYEIINLKKFLEISSNCNFDEKIINRFLKGDILDSFDSGIYYDKFLPNGYIGICHRCKITGDDSKMLVVGELSKNYQYFYKRIAS